MFPLTRKHPSLKHLLYVALLPPFISESLETVDAAFCISVSLTPSLALANAQHWNVLSGRVSASDIMTVILLDDLVMDSHMNGNSVKYSVPVVHWLASVGASVNVGDDAPSLLTGFIPFIRSSLAHPPMSNPLAADLAGVLPYAALGTLAPLTVRVCGYVIAPDVDVLDSSMMIPQYLI